MSTDPHVALVREAMETGEAESPGVLDKDKHFLTVQVDPDGEIRVIAELMGALNMDDAILNAVNVRRFGGGDDIDPEGLTDELVEDYVALHSVAPRSPDLEVRLERVLDNICGAHLGTGKVRASLYSPEMNCWNLDFGASATDAQRAAVYLVEAEAALDSLNYSSRLRLLDEVYAVLTPEERHVIADIIVRSTETDK